MPKAEIPNDLYVSDIRCDNAFASINLLSLAIYFNVFNSSSRTILDITAANNVSNNQLGSTLISFLGVKYSFIFCELKRI